MKTLNLAFPFLVTLFLWRVALPFWNPAGVLAIIPIFYYSFIRPVPWFAPFAFLICLLIDYVGGTVLFWTFAWCLAYTVNGLQTVVDLTRDDFGGLFIFGGFFSVCILILTIINFTWVNLGVSLWLVIWASVMYVLFVNLAKRVSRD